MKTKMSLWIVLMLSLTLAVGPSTSVAQTKVLNAQETTPKRTDLLTNDLAEIAGKHVAVYRVEIPPGGVAGKHRHPVDTFVYVLSGTLTLEQEGQGSRTLKVGEVFQEVPGGIYNAKNTGTSPLTLLVGLSGRQGPALFRSGEIGSTTAAVRWRADQRKELEQLCRYITRPAIANERLKRNRTGQVVLQLKSPYKDGTTHIVMEPLEFMERLAALVPRQHIRWNREADLVGGFQIDHQLKLGRLFDRKISGVDPL